MTLIEALPGLIASQRVAFLAFYRLEVESGLVPAVSQFPVDLNSAVGQHWIRLFCWRTVEEVAEVRAARQAETRVEELADVLIYLLDLMILTGSRPTQLATSSGFEDIPMLLAGMTSFLKVKPWRKKSGLMVHLPLINHHMEKVLGAYVQLISRSGFILPEVLKAYERKYEVNMARINELSNPTRH